MNFQVKHLLKKGDLFYRRRVPADVWPQFGGKEWIYQSLKTHDLARACQLCTQLTQEHDATWEVLRMPGSAVLSKEAIREAAEKLLLSWGAQRSELNPFAGPVEYKPTVKQKLEGYFEKKYHSDVPTLIDQGKLAEHEIEAFALLSDNPKNIPLSEALEFYLSEHKNKDNHLFCTKARLAIQLAVQAFGDKPIVKITREDARQMRDRISVGRKTTTIRRNLGIVSAVINFAIREKELSSTNPFEALQIAGEGEDSEIRIPFSHDELLMVSKAAREKNEQFAWISSILIETGARIGEIACAKVEDVFLDEPIPYIHLREHLDEGRRLKTGSGSERVLITTQGLRALGCQAGSLASWHQSLALPKIWS
jgi:hypothetical protein